MAAINAYVSDRLKDRTIEEAEVQDRSVSWVVTQALELWLLLQPMPGVRAVGSDLTPGELAIIERRIDDLRKERGE